MPPRPWIPVATAVLALAAATAASADGDPPPAPGDPTALTADRIVLRDGRVIEGRIQAEDDAAYAVRVRGALRLVEKSGVATVTRAAPPAPGTPAEEAATGGPAGGTDAGSRGRRRAAAGPDGGKPTAGTSGQGDAVGEAAAEGTAMGAGAPPPAPAGEPSPRRERRRAGRSEAADALGEEALRWVDECIHALGDGDPVVRRSAAAALVAVGPAALPRLRAARDGADPYLRGDLTRILALLEREPRGGDPRPPAGRAMMDRVRAGLALDDATAAAVEPLLVAFADEVRELVADARDGILAAEDARARFADRRERLRTDLAAHLSAEQIRRLDALIDDAARRMTGGAPGGAPPPGTPPGSAR